jgi:hypothetical protein
MLGKVLKIRYFLRKDGGLFWSFDLLHCGLITNFFSTVNFNLYSILHFLLIWVKQKARIKICI